MIANKKIYHSRRAQMNDEKILAYFCRNFLLYRKDGGDMAGFNERLAKTVEDFGSEACSEYAMQFAVWVNRIHQNRMEK